MDITLTVQQLRDLGMDDVRVDEPLSRHTSFRIGGPAKILVVPKDLAQVVSVLTWLRDNTVPYFILGQGTNVLVSDYGVDAVVVSVAPGLKQITVEDHTILAGSGVLLAKIARHAQKHGLTGMEFAVSIPGTLGGALVMNAGAHGSAMVDVVESVRVWDPDKGVHHIKGEDAEFQYRQSRFMKTPWIALEAQLRLKSGDPEQIRQVMEKFMAHRKSTQPVGEPNAGSVFKNPLPLFAGRLIEEIGAKGWTVGHAQVSTVHANFIVNNGSARASDVLHLMRKIRCVVYQRFGVTLRPEVRWIGRGEGGATATWENLWFKEGEGLMAPCE